MAGIIGIFYIVVIAIIISAAKAGRTGARGASHRSSAELMKNMERSMEVKTQNLKQEIIQRRLAEGKPITQNKGFQKNKPTAKPNVPRKEKKISAYMKPHMEEANQPQIRHSYYWKEDKYADKRIVALRLMEGDPVPNGYEKIKCPYCAADNLVTKNCRQYHSCYFCRVPID